MSIRNIVKKGDECLTRKCRPVTDFNLRLAQLLDDMRETLADAEGAGLAAPQVGVLRSCAVVLQPDGSMMDIVNPEILQRSGEQSGPEGCLSVPGLWGLVSRPMKVRVRAQDRHGKWFEIEAEGFTARAFCHEIDHLHGVLFTELATEYIDPEDLE